MRRVVLVVVMLSTTQIAAGQDEEIKKALATCAALGNETARLDCFEQLTRAVTQIPFKPLEPRVSKFKGSAEPGKWKVEVSTNPVDDSKSVALGLVDDSDVMQLVLLCQHAKAEVYVNAAKYLGERGVQVLARFGEAKPETKRWSVSRNGRVASLPGDAAPFIARMLTAQRLVIQIDPSSDSPITAVFKLGDLPNVVTPFKETCPLP